MLQKQKIFSFLQLPEATFLIITTIAVTIAFLILEPKISVRIFPQEKSQLLSAFIAQVEKTNTIRPQSYWQLREFYYPGSFLFSKTGLNTATIKKYQSQVPVEYTKNDIAILAFQSQKSWGLEFLTTGKDILSYVTIPSGSKIIEKNTNEIVYQNKNTTVIGLLLPISEMKKANGFFDYPGDDKKLVTGKNWLTVTAFQTN